MSAEAGARSGMTRKRLLVSGGVLALGVGIATWYVFAEWGSPNSAATEQRAEKSQPAGQRVRAATPNTSEIVLGMSATFTGPSRGLGIELYRGSKAYFDHVNSLGGIHGRKVVIRAYDDGYNPGPAIDNTVRLIEDDGVFLLFNYVGTPTTTRLPAASEAEPRSVASAVLPVHRGTTAAPTALR